jgi:hypothetical protein
METPAVYRFCLSLLLFLFATASPNALRADVPSVSPLFTEVTNQFTTMKSTLYHYRVELDRAGGSYKYDCVGLVWAALKQATPQAWDSLVKSTGVPKGRIATPQHYRAFFASLSAQPQRGWQAITNVANLRPGDVVAWEHKTANAVGHAVITGEIPVRAEDGEWTVKVFDSTSSPHAQDSRPGDERAGFGVSGRRSGLGHGVMVFISDPKSGVLTGLRWSLNAKAVTVPIAAGRPVF